MTYQGGGITEPATGIAGSEHRRSLRGVAFIRRGGSRGRRGSRRARDSQAFRGEGTGAQCQLARTHRGVFRWRLWEVPRFRGKAAGPGADCLENKLKMLPDSDVTRSCRLWLRRRLRRWICIPLEFSGVLPLFRRGEGGPGPYPPPCGRSAHGTQSPREHVTLCSRNQKAGWRFFFFFLSKVNFSFNLFLHVIFFLIGAKST